MSNTCNIYYNSLNRKWLFFEVSETGKEKQFSDGDLDGLTKGEETRLSYDHLETIKTKLNREKIFVKIYESDSNLIAEDVKSSNDIHVEILSNNYISKRLGEIEKELQGCIPNCKFEKILINHNDTQDIRRVLGLLASIKSLVENIDNRTKNIDKIMSEADKRLKGLGIGDIPQYKEQIINTIDKDITNKIKLNTVKNEALNNIFELSSELKRDKDRIDGVLKLYSNDIKKIPEQPLSTRLYTDTLSQIARSSGPASSAVNLAFGAIVIISIPIFVWLRGAPWVKRKQLEIFQKFWKDFISKMRDLIRERSSAWVKIITGDTKQTFRDIIESLETAETNLQNMLPTE